MSGPETARAARRAPMEPLAMPALKRGFCDWCGKKARRRSRYCSSACRIRYAALLARQGKTLAHLLKLWRIHRGRKGTDGKWAYDQLCRRLDRDILAEDRARWAGADEGARDGRP